jgi:hypothetical protein
MNTSQGSTTFSELDGTDKFTLSMWIKPTDLTIFRMLYHIPRTLNCQQWSAFSFVKTNWTA